MRRAFVSSLAAAIACLAGVTPTAEAGPPSSMDVQVMTQNQYVGANLFPLIPALASGNPAVINSALVGVISTISANRTVDRVNTLSREILDRKPDFVGIQEAWLIWCEPIDAAPCTNPEFAGAWGDHLAQTEYLLAGAYTKAAYIENFEFGYPFWDSQGNQGFAYVLDRDAVFVRNGITYSLPVPGTDYPCAVPFLAGSGCTFNVNTPPNFDEDAEAETYILHGFMVVDATVGGKPYRFVNTHPENGCVDGSPGRDPVRAGGADPPGHGRDTGSAQADHRWRHELRSVRRGGSGFADSGDALHAVRGRRALRRVALQARRCTWRHVLQGGGPHESRIDADAAHRPDPDPRRTADGEGRAPDRRGRGGSARPAGPQPLADRPRISGCGSPVLAAERRWTGAAPIGAAPISRPAGTLGFLAQWTPADLGGPKLAVRRRPTQKLASLTPICRQTSVSGVPPTAYRRARDGEPRLPAR